MSKRVRIPVTGSRLSLSGHIRVGGEGPNRRIGLILTHPHPKLGGNSQNNVSQAVFSSLSSYTCLAFDSRGVGRSQGSSSWTGTSERQDVISAVHFLLNYQLTESEEERVEQIYLVGYSFGSSVALSVLEDIPQVVGAVAISYPAGFLSRFILGHHIAPLRRSDKPKLFLLGDQDNFASPGQLNTMLSRVPNHSLKVIKDSDHFWFDHEGRLVPHIRLWLQQQQQQQQQQQAGEVGASVAKVHKAPSSATMAYDYMMDSNLWVFGLLLCLYLYNRFK